MPVKWANYRFFGWVGIATIVGLYLAQCIIRVSEWDFSVADFEKYSYESAWTIDQVVYFLTKRLQTSSYQMFYPSEV